MKKIIVLTLALLLISSSAYALIQNSKHDLTVNSTAYSGANAAKGNINETEICTYCHTPHKALTTLPLWNRAASGGTYTTYISPTNTLDGTIVSPATAGHDGSTGCLSCHDGVVAMNTVSNASPDWLGAGANFTAGTVIAAAGKMNTGAAGYIGTDLRDDHPIAITYTNTGGNEMVALGTVQGYTDVKLFGASNNQVECASCHKIHGTAAGNPLLRKSNASSALCLACHAK